MSPSPLDLLRQVRARQREGCERTFASHEAIVARTEAQVEKQLQAIQQIRATELAAREAEARRLATTGLTAAELMQGCEFRTAQNERERAEWVALAERETEADQAVAARDLARAHLTRAHVEERAATVRALQIEARALEAKRATEEEEALDAWQSSSR